MLKKHVVVDGSNIATEARTTPSLTQLDEAVRAFLEEHPSEQVTVIVDATFGHRIHESEQEAFEQAVDAGEVLTAPAGTIGRGDAFVLEVAEKADATVLSNDSFQEFHGKHPWLFDEGRLVGGKPVPGVGWIFLLRSPVRGPVSRRAVKEAKGGAGGRGGSGAGGARTAKKGAKKAAKKAAKKQPATAKRARSTDEKTSEAVARAVADDGSGARKRARQPLEPLNEPLPFIEFVGAHPVGSTVHGEVERFSSHGAYVVADGARCYVPLKLMGDPPPKSAKEILRVGEARDFVVFAIDPPRRGIDLALTSDSLATSHQQDIAADLGEQVSTASNRASTRGSKRSERRERDNDARTTPATRATDATCVPPPKTHTQASTLATNTRADQRAEEAPVTPARKRKAAAKRTAKKSAKRSPARRKKAAAKRPAKKRATKKRATKKRAAKRSPARRKKAAAKRPAKKRASKKRATKKRATKKRASKKRAAKRPAKKRASKKRASKRAPAKRATKKRATKRRARRR